MIVLRLCLLWVLVVALARCRARPSLSLNCRPTGVYANIYHLQDTSPDMAFHTALMTNGVLTALEDWGVQTFPAAFVQSLASFSDKADCWNLLRPPKAESMQEAYSAIAPAPQSSAKRDVLDALYIAATSSWPAIGTKTIIVYTVKDFMLPPLWIPNLPPFSSALPMEACAKDAAPLYLVEKKLNENGFRVVFVVPDHLISMYTNMFSLLDNYIVVPMRKTEDNFIKSALEPALNHLFCPTTTTTTTTITTLTTTTTPDPIVTTPAVFITTGASTSTGDACGPDVQLPHPQDFSFNFLLTLKIKCCKKLVALKTLVDKA